MYICTQITTIKTNAMTTLKQQWEAKQQEIFMLQDTEENNREQIDALELEIHELMRQDYENNN